MTICFTGPRPKQLHGYDEAMRPLYVEIVSFTQDVILGFAQNNPGICFISGGAQGFDQLAFWAVEKAKQQQPELNIINKLYIPFEQQPSCWSPDGMFGRKEYLLMRRRANITRIVSPNPVPNDSRAAVKALHERNHAMVQDSDLVIAFLANRSLDWEHSSGGTAECVRYARSQDRPVFAIEYYPDSDTKFTIKKLGFPEENTQIGMQGEI